MNAKSGLITSIFVYDRKGQISQSTLPQFLQRAGWTLKVGKNR